MVPHDAHFPPLVEGQKKREDEGEGKKEKEKERKETRKEKMGDLSWLVAHTNIIILSPV